MKKVMVEHSLMGNLKKVYRLDHPQYTPTETFKWIDDDHYLYSTDVWKEKVERKVGVGAFDILELVGADNPLVIMTYKEGIIYYQFETMEVQTWE